MSRVLNRMEKSEPADDSVLSTFYSVLSPHYFCDLTADLLRLEHSIRFRANGKSMHPTIREGEMITVEPIAPSDVRLSDIIFYRARRGVIAHRVARIGRTEQRGLSNEQEKKNRPDDPQSSALSPQHFFILRGDASDSCDEPVEAGQVLGKVVAVERNGRSIALDGRWATMLRTVREHASRLRRAISYQRSGTCQDRPIWWPPLASSTGGFRQPSTRLPKSLAVLRQNPLKFPAFTTGSRGNMNPAFKGPKGRRGSMFSCLNCLKKVTFWVWILGAILGAQVAEGASFSFRKSITIDRTKVGNSGRPDHPVEFPHALQRHRRQPEDHDQRRARHQLQRL